MQLLTFVSTPMKEIVEGFTQAIRLNLAYYVSIAREALLSEQLLTNASGGHPNGRRSRSKKQMRSPKSTTSRPRLPNSHSTTLSTANASRANMRRCTRSSNTARPFGHRSRLASLRASTTTVSRRTLALPRTRSGSRTQSRSSRVRRARPSWRKSGSWAR